MVASFNSFNYHVINIDLRVSPYLVNEDSVHEQLVGGASVLEAEGHAIVVGVAMIRHKVVLRVFKGFICIWLYSEYASMKLNIR